MVERVCGTPQATFLKVAETLCQASGPERTGVDLLRCRLDPAHHRRPDDSRGHDSAVACWAISAGPGGGILALRGHASIQGSTDIPTLYNLLPGYLNTPSALKNHDTLADYIETEISADQLLVNFPKFIVSLLTAWFGAAATKENDFGFGWLPRNVGDHSHCRCSSPCPRARFTVSWRWARTRPWAARTRHSSGRPWPSSTGWSSETCTRPRPPRSGLTAPR